MESAHIVNLEGGRAISFWAYGSTPEYAAWEKLRLWAGGRGLLVQVSGSRIFGFNNPNPSEGSPNYGYELWLLTGSDVEVEGDARLIDFPGGQYAVMSFHEPDSDYNVTIPAAWAQLNAWVEANSYRMGSHQWLEEFSHEGKVIAFYYPILE